MKKLPVIVAALSLSGYLPAMAQNRGPELPIPTWQAPALWDGASALRELSSGRQLKGEIQRASATAGAVLTGGTPFIAIVPCRLMDTSDVTLPPPFGPPSLAANQVRTITIPANTRCNIPSSALAYSLNFTVIPQGPLGYLSAWPTPIRPSPEVSILNSLGGQILANAAVVASGTNGAIDVFVTNTADVIIDINGYYAPQISLANGSAAAPTLTFGGDQTTGLYSSGAGSVNIATGGQNRFTVRADGDLDLTGNVRKGGALFLHNLGGSGNTAIGLSSLAVSTGDFNTATGVQALSRNTTGAQNVAVGVQALSSNTTGSSNTAIGTSTLSSNTTGQSNTASGLALDRNTSGSFNTATGFVTLPNNTTGNSNTAVGSITLFNNVTGSFNIALGAGAGYYLTGSNNIDIGTGGTDTDTGVIRIGNNGTHSSFFAAGVWGHKTGVNDAVPVVMDSSGQLGTVSSSRRFKEDITDMNDGSSGLFRLRPVTFRYKKPYEDGSRPLDYGLIAEEVAEVYPSLVVKGSDGQVETVQYQKLTPMMLNELQKQHREAQREQETVRQLSETVDSLRVQVAALQKMVDALLGAGAPAQ